LIYLSITGILATFDISKEVQEDGLEVTPKLEFTTGITRYGLDLSTLFLCSLTGVAVIPSHSSVGYSLIEPVHHFMFDI
jgi:hypothetical protein